MRNMNFPPLWIAWIQECLSTTTFAVMVKGCPTGFFKGNKGIHQGDPLSLYHCPSYGVLVYTNGHCCCSWWYPIYEKRMRNYVSHLLYAEDMLIFLKASRKSIMKMNNLLQTFSSQTRLCINKSKSKMYFSKSSKNKQLLSDLIGIPEGNLPTRYLGIPLSINHLKARHYSVLLDKCRMKVEGWAAHTLSFVGRI